MMQCGASVTGVSFTNILKHGLELNGAMRIYLSRVLILSLPNYKGKYKKKKKKKKKEALLVSAPWGLSTSYDGRVN